MARITKGLRVKKWLERNVPGYLFLLPFALLFFLFILLPILVALYNSLTSNNMIEPVVGVGLLNYKNLLFRDDVFFLSLKNTFVFALITGPLGFAASFLFAWLISSMKFRNLLSLAFYVPSITSGVAMTVVWGYIFSSDRYGLINNFLIKFSFIPSAIEWNLNAATILPVIMIISVWMSMGTGFLVFLAGLQNVPRELYEVAKIDGVSSMWQELWYITLPTMKPQLLFGAINAIVASFAVFDVAVTFAGMPSPNYAGHTIVVHMYDYAFIRFQMGYASAVAVILFVITFSLGQLAKRIFRSDS